MTDQTYYFTVTDPTPPVGGGSSVLAAIAAELAAARPSAPMWSVELPTTTSQYLAQSYPAPTRPAGATTINQGIGYDGSALGPNRAFKGQKVSSYKILTGDGGPYSSHWDSTKGEWWLCYGTTGWDPWAMTVVRYQMARDEFRHWQAASDGDHATSLWDPYGHAHNFGMSCIDVVGRKLYRLLRTSTYGVVQPDGSLPTTGQLILAWMSLDDPTQRGTVYPTGATTPWMSDPGTSHHPIEFFPEMGAQGSVVFFRFNNGSTNTWRTLDIATGVLALDITPPMFHGRRPPMARCNGAIYGVDPAYVTYPPTGRTWRLNANKTVDTDLTPPPVIMNGEAHGAAVDYCHTEFAALGTKIYAFRTSDPANGEGEVWCFDTLALAGKGSWTLVDRMVQSTVGGIVGGTGFSVAAVPELGVIVYAQALPIEADVAIVWKP